MSEILQGFNEKFKVNDFKIYETKYWIWSLRPHQATIGAGILSLKRECVAFSDLTKEEYGDLGEIIKVIESSLSKTFNYDVINYLMLMMFDKQVHYHVFPRYNRSLVFQEEKWTDDNWPAIPNLQGDPKESQILKNIVSQLKCNIEEV